MLELALPAGQLGKFRSPGNATAWLAACNFRFTSQPCVDCSDGILVPTVKKVRFNTPTTRYSYLESCNADSLKYRSAIPGNIMHSQALIMACSMACTWYRLRAIHSSSHGTSTSPRNCRRGHTLTSIDHRLHSEDMSFPHDANRLVTRIVGHIRCTME